MFGRFYEMYILYWLAFGRVQTNFFQTWYGGSLQFDIRLNDLDLPSRSHSYEKAKTCATNLLQNSMTSITVIK